MVKVRDRERSEILCMFGFADMLRTQQQVGQSNHNLLFINMQTIETSKLQVHTVELCP